MYPLSTSIRTRPAFLIACLSCLFLASCTKEARLTPSASNQLFTLPQGNHAYDTSILNFYNQYNSTILYRWSFPTFDYSVTHSQYSSRLYAIQADTNAVAPALTFLQTHLFGWYPSSFLQKTMPMTILLASELDSLLPDFTTGNNLGDTVRHVSVSSVAGLYKITFGLANDSLSFLTDTQTIAARKWLHVAYWQQAQSVNSIERPTGFDVLTNYTAVTQPLANYGILQTHPSYDAGTDFLDYIGLITSTTEAAIDSTWLSPQTDVNGLYRKKYELITSYYLNHYGVNLQAIGNKQ